MPWPTTYPMPCGCLLGSGIGQFTIRGDRCEHHQNYMLTMGEIVEAIDADRWTITFDGHVGLVTPPLRYYREEADA